MVTNLDWSIPLDSSEIVHQAVAVWCQTEELAEEFLEHHNYKRATYPDHKWLAWWKEYGSECCFFVNVRNGELMYGPRDSLDDYYLNQGYVPRIYIHETTFASVEVGDLL